MKYIDMQGGLPDVVTEAEWGSCHNAFAFEDLIKSHSDIVVPLSFEWESRAQDELQEKSEWRDRDIQALRDLVLAEETLMCSTTDEFLIKFLRAKKFDYDKSLRMVQRYCAMRSRSPQNFSKSLPSLSKETLECQLQNILPYRDHLARRIFIFRAGKWITSLTTPQDIFSTNFMCLELMAREVKTQISGIVAVVDMEGFGWHHITNLSVEYVRNVVALIQNSFPIRFREIHIVNESYLFDIVYALVKPFLSDKIRNRIRFHGSDLESLHKHISPTILPTEYGGSQGPFDNSHLVEALHHLEEYFVQLSQCGYTDNMVPAEVYNDKETTHPFPSFCLSGTVPE